MSATAAAAAAAAAAVTAVACGMVHSCKPGAAARTGACTAEAPQGSSNGPRMRCIPSADVSATAGDLGRHAPEPERPADLAFFVDNAGRELCLKFHGFQRGKCRHGVECHRSHAAPSADSLLRLRSRQKAQEEADRAAAERHAAEARAAWDKPLPPWLHEARSELIFRTDTTTSFERMCAAARLFLAPTIKEDTTGNDSQIPLELLHEIPPAAHHSPPVCPSLLHAYQLGGHKLPPSWKKALLHKQRLIGRFQKTDAYKAWIEAYRDFVRDVVAPRCGDPHGVVFQCPPTLRIHMPGRVPTIGVHTDSQ